MAVGSAGRAALDRFKPKDAHEKTGKNTLDAQHHEGARRNQPAQIILGGGQQAKMSLFPKVGEIMKGYL